MKNSDLYQLIFECLENNDTGDLKRKINNYIINDVQNFYRFIHLSSNHLVLPALFNRLQKLGLTKYIEHDFNEHLFSITELNKNRNEEILIQADELSRYLFEEGIEPIYLKGTGNLLDDLYLEKSDRIIGDIDFLVQDKDFLRTIEITNKLGYKTDKKIYDDFKHLKDHPHQYGNYATNIEIHRLPVIIKHAKWLTTEEIFNEKKQIISRVNCFVPSDNHKLIINFIHSQLSDNGHKLRIISLRDLYDVRLISQRLNHVDIISEIDKKERNKAKKYFDFSAQIINDKRLSNNVQSRYYNQHLWLMNHPRIHSFFIYTIKIIDLIFLRFLKAIYNKSVFQNLIVRITDRDWWRDRFFNGLKKYFSKNYL